ncbi:MAG: hypothetical protein QME12_05915 [Nanoarchaeota archaeon]|nr:hypothetical protein [Nanoarchaeota archaeon]
MDTQILCGNGKTLEVVTSSDGRYNAGLAKLRTEGLLPEDMTMKRVAQAKLLAGDANDLWQKGRWTSNGFVYLPNNADILVTAPKYTPFLKYIDKAVAEHDAGRESYVGDEFQEIMDNAKTHPADAIKSGVLLLKRQGLRTELPTEAFGDMPVTCFLLEEIAGDYGFALKNKGRKSIPLIVAGEDYARKQNRPFSRGLRVDYLSYSALRGDVNFNYNFGLVSGVRELSQRSKQRRVEHGSACSFQWKCSKATRAGTGCCRR